MIVNQPFQLNQEALRAQLKGMENLIANAPAHVLQEVQHRQQIDAHNTAVEAAKAKKAQFRKMAKQSRIPVEVLKRMVKSVQRTK
jgi:hypothetical protein